MQAIEMNAEVTEDHEIHLKLPNNISSNTVKVIVMYEEENNDLLSEKKRQFGQFKGQITIKDDFDDPLPDTYWKGEGA